MSNGLTDEEHETSRWCVIGVNLRDLQLGAVVGPGSGRKVWPRAVKEQWRKWPRAQGRSSQPVTA